MEGQALGVRHRSGILDDGSHEGVVDDNHSSCFSGEMVEEGGDGVAEMAGGAEGGEEVRWELVLGGRVWRGGDERRSGKVMEVDV